MVELSEVVARLGGDREFAAECAELFSEELPALLASLRDGLRQASADQVNRVAHALKGAAGNFCIAGPTTVAGNIERLAGDGRLDEADRLMPLLERELDQLIDTLRALRSGPAS